MSNEYQEYPQETKSQKFWRLFLNGGKSKPKTLVDKFEDALESNEKIVLNLYEGQGPPRFHDYWLKWERHCDSVKDFVIGVSLNVEGQSKGRRTYLYKREVNGKAPAQENIYNNLRTKSLEKARIFAQNLVNIAKEKGIDVLVEDKL